MAGAAELLHGTAVALGDAAVLIRGPSGSGKSDLALRCLALAPAPSLGITGALRLVADDQVLVSRQEDGLWVTCPPAIAGRLEVRGIGIVEAVATSRPVQLALVADVDPSAHVERLPDADDHLWLMGIAVPTIALRAFEASAAIKLVMALARAVQSGRGR